MIRGFDSTKTRLLALGLSVAVLVAIVFAEEEGRRPPQHQGTWIWEAQSIIGQGDDILRFAERQGLTHIYLYADREKVAPYAYARFIREATQRGIKVEALGGDPSWGRKEKRHYLQSFIDWVASYNTNVDEQERFAGLHLDIEPYLTPEWETERPRVIEEWLSNLEFAAYHARAIGDLDVSLDVPFWIHGIEVPGYERFAVSTWLFKRFETVVLMDYRDTAEGADGIVSNAMAAVEEAGAMGKSVVVGVEFAPNAEAEKTTFFEEGLAAMERELDETRRQFQTYSGFRGVAVHGFPEWMSADREGESH